MPIWLFRKRRRSATKDATAQPLNEKAPPPLGPPPTAPVASGAPSRRSSHRKRRASQHPDNSAQADLPVTGARSTGRPDEEKTVQRKGSNENITALPNSRHLQQSPHLRPADMERPHIPYNFRTYSGSQTSIQRQEALGSPIKSHTLRSKRSSRNPDTPQRRRSSRRQKDDHVREEEIRAMSAAIPMPKRPGGFAEGPLRRDSKKLRGLNVKDSMVSLPPEDSIHSAMSGVLEQRGWEIGSLDVFNPRPAVRLSGTPQYVAPGSIPSPVQLGRDASDRNKKPVTRESGKKRQTIGNEADDLDASDLRLLLERDAKRRERRKIEQQEKLDRKLRSRAGRSRGDSDKKRQDTKDRIMSDDEKGHGELATTSSNVQTPSSKVEKAGDLGLIGLGIGAEKLRREQRAEQTPDSQPKDLEYKQLLDDPFADPITEQTQSSIAQPEVAEATMKDIETPSRTKDSDVYTPLPVSQTSTPPLSPVGRTPNIHTSTLAELTSMEQKRRTSDLPAPPPITDQRRSSAPKESRAGAWASFFRRSGTTTSRKPLGMGTSSPSEASFSNTSRESMRNQPLPAHLVDTQPRSVSRSTSGAPVRTQSKFREDLPEMPLSPPDSRMPSPDVTTMAAAAAAARRSKKSEPVDIPGSRARDLEAGRSDTPMSPGARHGLVSASLASVDSEGSWLASGSVKRQSNQSALSRSMGSLSKRRPDFTASYEELGGDKDAEYFRRMTPSPDSRRVLQGEHLEGSDPASPSPNESGGYGDVRRSVNSGEPLTIHDSVRRQPTLVKRDPKVRSREGLLAEYSGETETPEPSSPTGDDVDPDSPEPEMRSAKSVDLGKGHVRHVSAGSARLLDLHSPRRDSTDLRRISTPAATAATPTSPTSQTQEPQSSQHP